MDPPAFRQDLRFFERVEQLAVEKLRQHLCSVIPSFRQASSTARPLPVSTSIVRRCCRISSGVYRFLGIAVTSLFAVQPNIHTGPVWPGQVTYSHIVLDSFMHHDITPLAPFSNANPLLQVVSLSTLHWFCLVAGAAGLCVLGIRRLLREENVP